MKFNFEGKIIRAVERMRYGAREKFVLFVFFKETRVSRMIQKSGVESPPRKWNWKRSRVIWRIWFLNTSSLVTGEKLRVTASVVSCG